MMTPRQHLKRAVDLYYTTTYTPGSAIEALDRACGYSQLVESLEELARRAEGLSQFAGSKWAEDASESAGIDLCQEIHWLNEARKEALIVLEYVETR